MCVKMRGGLYGVMKEFDRRRGGAGGQDLRRKTSTVREGKIEQDIMTEDAGDRGFREDKGR